MISFCFSSKQKIFLGTFDLLFILLLLFIFTLLTSPTIPSLLSQHRSLYSFNMYLNDYFVSLEPQTFGFPLDSCPNILSASHVQRLGCKLFHYFFFFFLLYIVVVINFFKLFKSDMYVGPSNSTLY